MIYWRIQMYKPHGRGEIEINSIELLKEKEPIIGTGEWDDFQCRYFKGEGGNAMKIGDIVMFHRGKTPIALCQITSESFKNQDLQRKYINENYRKVKILEFYSGNEIVIDNQGTLKRFVDQNSITWRFINKWYFRIKKNMNKQETIKLLNYKKQIILQGPPGTGKTRLAKEVAIDMLINQGVLLANLNKGDKIPSPGGDEDYYEIIAEFENGVNLKSKHTSEEGQMATYDGIKKYILRLLADESIKPRRGEQTYELAVAKHYVNTFLSKNQYNIIQFHPSYTYEDFVRGITVKSKGGAISYNTENKLLARVADEAQKNYRDSQKESAEISYEKWLEEQFELFKDAIMEEIDKNERYALTDVVGIGVVGQNYFQYFGNGWDDYIKYTSFLSLFHYKLFTLKEIRNQLSINSRATYYAKLAEKFKLFIAGKDAPKVTEKIALKNYVIIIDEINRANLASVLGELIYALEYRGEAVDAMYDLNQSNDDEKPDKKLIIPDNLYIIGTMNTADRSVGQIDYAIRRRFAFKEILPKLLGEVDLENGLKFKTNVFQQVATLFDKSKEHLNTEFEANDVQLGHSYFIYKTEEEFQLKLDYEIKPILKEYVSDGILNKSALLEIAKLGSELE